MIAGSVIASAAADSAFPFGRDLLLDSPPMKGSKRLVVLLDAGQRDTLDSEQIAGMGEFASIVWRGAPETDARELSEHEYAM
jgi:hypothetical protein